MNEDISVMEKYEIMCFGDSNTWGTVAKKRISDPNLRYGRDVRWTCILQDDLGDEYAVSEEGLGGRTTIYTAAPEFPYKNGLVMYEGCIKTHHPLDLIILMLGTNDIHLPWKLPGEELGTGIRTLVEITKAHPEWGRNENTVPEILIVAPPVVVPSCPEGRTEVYPQFFGEYGTEMSRRFPEVFRAIAEEYGCHFLSSQDYAHADKNDGVHLDAESHIRLGHAIARKVREIRNAR